MFKHLLNGVLIVTLIFFLSPRAEASIVILASGQRVDGQIINQTDMCVTLNVYGNLKTYYFGEVASIDGKEIDISPPQKSLNQPIPISMPEVKIEHKPAPIPFFDDEEVSLIRFMNVRHLNVPVYNKPVDQNVASVPTPSQSPITKTPPLPAEHPNTEKVEPTAPGTDVTINKTGDINKTVVTTPDGGLIVVSTDKITKFDKDLNVIKEVALKAGNTPSSK